LIFGCCGCHEIPAVVLWSTFLLHIVIQHWFLCHGGVELVSSWVSKWKNFSIFDKQMIYFPIILQKHWSLFVACNPGMARTVADSGSNHAENAQMPFILHLASLKLHNSSVIAQNIRNFFTLQWQKEFSTDTFQFTKTNYPVICPIGMYAC
jgi:Ulp1 family protease